LPKVLANLKEVSEDQWLELRKKGIGGSDAAAITGYNNYTSPIAIYMDKLGLAESGVDNKFTRWGKLLEPIIREEFPQDIWDEEGNVAEPTEYPFLIQSDNFPFMLASPDGRVGYKGEVGGLEIKTATILQADKWREGELPDHHYCQVQHYMAVDGLPFYLVVALIGKDLVWRYVPGNLKFQSEIIEAEKAFWYDHVVEQVPPMPTGSEDEADYLLKLYPEGEGEIFAPEMGEEAAEYKTVAAEIERLKIRKEQIANDFKRRMGEKKVMLMGGFKASWPRFPMKTFNKKKLSEEHPDIYEKYVGERLAGRLTISEVKKKNE